MLLVGDAAGYVDALTGEGIAVGLASARALVDCVSVDDPARYEKEWLHGEPPVPLDHPQPAVRPAAASGRAADRAGCAADYRRVFGAAVNQLAR